MELDHVGSLNVDLATDRIFMMGGTANGDRMIGEISGAWLVGQRISAQMKGLAAADWATIGPNGLARFDIRMVLETTDEALLYLTYKGKADWSAGPGTGDISVVAEFETGDDRYRWLTDAQVVGTGGLSADFTSVSYDLYRLV